MFQIYFFNGSHSIKQNLVYYQTPNCIFHTVNAKTKTKQTDLIFYIIILKPGPARQVDLGLEPI